MIDIEKSFEEVRDEVKAKVDLAVAVLQEAKDIAEQSKFKTPKGMDDYDDLRSVMSEFIDLDQGWSSSGCSF